MTLINVITVCSFLGILIAGLMVFILNDMRSKQAPARIKARMQASFFAQGSKLSEPDNFDAALFTVNQHGNKLSRWLSPKLARLNTVAGTSGIKIVIAAAVVAELMALAMTQFMPLPSIATPFLLLGLPVLAIMRAYRFLVMRFRKRFLDGFPDLLDLIVRAVRAGVPVTHVIGTITDDCPEPLRTEFRLMGDSLQLGIDLEEVFAVASKRIEVADFSFFCVCLLLQRETGGQLGETLENLASIVRTRREVSQKTKALTAEARITTKILAAIPVVVILMLFGSNRPYVMVLFNTPAGNKLLTYAAISVVLGILVINRMSKLNTAR